MNFVIRNSYKKIAEEFCRFYYTNYDNSFMELVHLYTADSKFTFLDNEIIGFNNLYDLLVNKYGVKSIAHNVTSVYSQPLGDKTVLVQAVGEVIINNCGVKEKFVETFILQYSTQFNSFFVCGTTFIVV